MLAPVRCPRWCPGAPAACWAAVEGRGVVIRATSAQAWMVSKPCTQPSANANVQYVFLMLCSTEYTRYLHTATFPPAPLFDPTRFRLEILFHIVVGLKWPKLRRSIVERGVTVWGTVLLLLSLRIIPDIPHRILESPLPRR